MRERLYPMSNIRTDIRRKLYKAALLLPPHTLQSAVTRLSIPIPDSCTEFFICMPALPCILAGNHQGFTLQRKFPDLHATVPFHPLSSYVSVKFMSHEPLRFDIPLQAVHESMDITFRRYQLRFYLHQYFRRLF